MNKFDISPEFAEQLGAYMEGNLPMEEASRMEQLINDNGDLCSFVNELNDCGESVFMDSFTAFNYLDLGTDFSLPEIPGVSFGFDNGFPNSGMEMFRDSSSMFGDNDNLGIGNDDMNILDENFNTDNNDLFNY